MDLNRIYVGCLSNKYGLVEMTNEFNISQQYVEITLTSYLCYSNKQLLLTCENEEFANGKIAIFDNNTFMIQECPGINPCYIGKKNYTYVANYDSASISIFKDNLLLKNIIFSNSKPHFIGFIKEYIIIIDKNNGDIILADDNLEVKHKLSLGKDVEPRHAVIKDNNIFIITEKNPKIITVALFQNKLILKDILPLNKSGTGCAIKEHNHKLYVTVRETNQIYVVDITENPKIVEKISCHGENPRDLCIVEDQYLLVANLDSNNVSVFNINNLQYIKDIPIDHPSCILYVKESL